MSSVANGRPSHGSSATAASVFTVCSDERTNEAEVFDVSPTKDFKSLVEGVMDKIVKAHELEVQALRHRLRSLSPQDSQDDDSNSVEKETFEEGASNLGYPSEVTMVQEAAYRSCPSIGLVDSPTLACEGACAPDDSFASILPGTPSDSSHCRSQTIASGPKGAAGEHSPVACRGAVEHSQSAPAPDQSGQNPSDLNARCRKRSSATCGAITMPRPPEGMTPVSANRALKEAEKMGLLSTNTRQLRKGWTPQTEHTATQSSLSQTSMDASEILDHSTTPRWQWLHRTGWRNYNQEETAHLERVFQSGDSKARLKSGKIGRNHPMEVFYSDMLQHDCSTRKVRSVRRLGRDAWWQRMRRFCLSCYRSWETGRPWMESFEQFYHNDIRSCRKMGARTKTGRFGPETDGQKTSVCSRIVENNFFAWFFTIMIVMNAAWIAIETDLNDAENIWKADLIFQVVENTFGIFFSLEIVLRFLSYARKLDAVFDAWFVFDSLCTGSMMTEIWFVPFFSWLISGQQSRADFSLSLFRLARLLRVTRVGRLVSILPDLITLLKGLCRSLKPVLVSTLLLSVLVLLFAILFRSQVKGTDLANCGYFHSIPETVFTLLFHGTLLDSVKKVIDEIRPHSSLLTFAFTVYIFVTHCAVLNLLIGIVCGVVTEVKDTDKEKTDKHRLTSCLSDIMRVYDKDGCGRLKKEEFELFITNPEVKRVLTEFQVDVWGLSTFMDVYAASLSQDVDDVDEGLDDGIIAFQSEEILDIVLRLRGGGGASVSDIVNLRRYAGQRLDAVESKVHDSHTDSVSKLRRIVECTVSLRSLHGEDARMNST